MPSKSKSDFILLSELIQKLAGKDYYRSYAKSLALTENTSSPLPIDDKLVEEMFYYFIKKNELEVYYKGCIATGEDIFKDDVYIKAQDLKKLYANKCIVFPNSLLTEISKR